MNERLKATLLGAACLIGRRIDGIRFKSGHGGVFTIRVDDEQIYDKTRGYGLASILEDAETRL